MRETEAGRKDNFAEITAPSVPSTVLTPAQVVHGPLVPAQQQILLYSGEQWELFVKEWAYFCLKKKYKSVQRFCGSGDHGVHIAGFVDEQRLQGVWDNFQCKHYDHPLRPSDVWAEFGKILWYSFRGEYAPPLRYYFVASRGIGTQLLGLLSNANKREKELIGNWDKNARNRIGKQEVVLEGPFLGYVERFDFSGFDSKTGLQIVEEHRTCPCYVPRFGGGLPPRPEAGTPPSELNEFTWISQGPETAHPVRD